MTSALFMHSLRSSHMWWGKQENPGKNPATCLKQVRNPDGRCDKPLSNHYNIQVLEDLRKVQVNAINIALSVNDASIQVQCTQFSMHRD